MEGYSFDRYLTVYQGDNLVKITKIMYENDVVIPATYNESNVTVAYVDIVGISTFKIQLENGNVVTATVK